MAVTNSLSDQLTNAAAVPVVRNNAVDVTGKLRIAYFSFTQGAAAGDATSTADLVKLPPGRVRVLEELSKIRFSAFGASRVLDIGYKTYTGNDGVAVAADDDGFATDIDVSAAGNATFAEANHAANTHLFQSRDGVTVYATVAGGTIPAAATLSGYVVYTMDA